MNPLKFIIKLFLKFFGIYLGLILLVSVSGFTGKARDFYGGTVNKYYKNLSSKAEIIAEPAKNEEKKLLIKILNKKDIQKAKEEYRRTGKITSGEILAYYTNSYVNFLMPLLFLLSLILIYPSDIKRKIKSLFSGLALMAIYIYFKLGCSIIYTIDESQKFFPEYELPDLLNTFLGLIEGLFTEAAYLTAILIWILVCFRKEDLKGILKLK